MANAYHGLFVDWDNTGSFSVGTLSATNIVTAVSGQNSTTYMIVNSADVSPMAKGQYVLWQSGSTPLGEGHVRMVMDVSTPFAGFVNISVFPPFPTVPATNDTLTQVTAFTGDDVTADRLASDLRIRIGRDVARSTAAIAPGTMDFELDNSSGDYMPDKASSPLTGKVLPGRPVKFVVSYNGTTYVLFRGYTDDYKITGSTVPGGSNGSVAITCTDVLSRVHAEKRLSTPLYESIRTGAAIGIILDQIGWSSGARDIDLGGTVINYGWEEGTEAWEAIQKIVRSEGPPALVTSDANGNFVFRDRHHRALDTRSKTVQATFRDSSGLTAVQWSRPLEYDYGYDALCNSVTFIVQERRPTNGPVEVWSTDSPFSVPASADAGHRHGPDAGTDHLDPQRLDHVRDPEPDKRCGTSDYVLRRSRRGHHRPGQTPSHVYPCGTRNPDYDRGRGEYRAVRPEDLGRERGVGQRSRRARGRAIDCGATETASVPGHSQDRGRERREPTTGSSPWSVRPDHAHCLGIWPERGLLH